MPRNAAISCCICCSCMNSWPWADSPAPSLASAGTAAAASNDTSRAGTVFFMGLVAQFYAAVLGPVSFAVAAGNRALFTVGHQLQLCGGNTLQHHVALDSLGTTLAQGHVVFAGTALVGVAFQNDTAAVAFQVAGVYVEGAHGFRLEVGAVELEVEGFDGAQRSFAAAVEFAAVTGTTGHAAVKACIGVQGFVAGIVAAFGGTAYCKQQGQGQ